MRSVTAILAAIWLAMLMGAAATTAWADDAVAEAPDFVLKALDGRNYRLSEYRGEVVALVFWASWCGGCRAELELLQSLYATHREAGLQVLAITVDEDVDAARSIATVLGAEYPLLWDTAGTVSRLYGLLDLPTTFLIDRSGSLRLEQRKADDRDALALQAALRLALDE